MTTPEQEVAQVVRATRRARGLQWLNGTLLVAGAGIFGWYVLGDRKGRQPGASPGDALIPAPDSTTQEYRRDHIGEKKPSK